MPTNDNESGSTIEMLRPAQAHGQAALILTESLIHGLIARAVLTTEESYEIVSSAVNVQADYAADAVDGLALEMRQSQELLTAIADSLKTDIAPATRQAAKPRLVDTGKPPPDVPLGEVSAPPKIDGIDE